MYVCLKINADDSDNDDKLNIKRYYYGDEVATFFSSSFRGRAL
jgi:hypothetical protein